LWAQQLSQQQQQQQHELDVLHSTNSSSGEQEAAVANQQPPQQQQQAVVPIRQHYLPFAAIRSMSPEAFVQLLQQELGAAGVVAGINYRFGEQC
jgi:FAD synthase